MTFGAVCGRCIRYNHFFTLGWDMTLDKKIKRTAQVRKEVAQRRLVEGERHRRKGDDQDD